MNRSLAFFVLVALVTSASAQDLFSGNDPVAFTRMEPLSASRHVRDYPLASFGQVQRLMHLAASSSTGTGAAVTIGRAYTADVRDYKFFGTLEMSANLHQSNMSDWVEEPCKREDFIWKRSIGGRFNNVNCVTINHLTGYYRNPTGIFQEFYRQFKDFGVEVPPTVLQIAFTRYASGGRLLTYRFTLSPESFGFDRDAETVWSASGWHKQASQRDPKKAEFLANLAKWAIDMQDRMDAAFNKDPSAFASVQPLTNYFLQPPAARPAAVASDTSTSRTENRLRQLKDLFDKNLLTEKVYREQVEAALAEK